MRVISRIAAFFTVALLLALLPGCGGDGCEYRLTYSVFFPPVHVQSKLAQEWADEIEKRTSGRVRVDVFPGGVLSGAAENYDCVANGVSDIGMSCLSYSRGLFPLLESLDFPFGYPDGMTATIIANEFLEHFKPEELNETHMLYLHAHGPGVLASRGEISGLDSIRHMSIRGTGITAQVIKELGGNAVGLPQGETFEALRKGVVEATLCPVETLKGWKQGEVINEVVKIPAIGYTTTMFVTMNKKTWSRLPEDIRKIIEDVSREWIPRHGKAWDEADAEGLEFIKELDKKYSLMDDAENEKFEKALEPLFEQWVQEAEEKGLPGKEAVEFVRKRLDVHAAAGGVK